MTAPRSTTLTRPADTREGMGRDEWREKAACRDEDPETFFPVATTNPRAYDKARAICAECPVRDACLAAALAAEGDWAGVSRRHGMYGGLTPAERAAATRSARRTPRPIDHGTPAGYRMHLRRGQDACGACLEAATNDRARRKPARKTP